MKRLFCSSILLLSFLAAAPIANATEAPVSIQQQDPKIKSYVINKDGKIFYGKVDVLKEMTQDMVLSDGTTIKTDGTVVFKDGKKSKLNNGDLIDLKTGNIHKSSK